MKRIYLLFAIFIILILFVGLTNVSAVDSSKWKTINIGDAEFKIPPEYENGSFWNNHTFCKDSPFNFEIEYYVTESKYEYYDFGDDITSTSPENIQIDTIGNHDVITFLNYPTSTANTDYFIEIYFICGNNTYRISQNGTNISENVKEIIKTSPKQNLTSQEFYLKFYNNQIKYMKYLDDIEWVSNDIQQFENQKNLERQAQNDNMYWYLFGYYSNNY